MIGINHVMKWREEHLVFIHCFRLILRIHFLNALNVRFYEHREFTIFHGIHRLRHDRHTSIIINHCTSTYQCRNRSTECFYRRCRRRNQFRRFRIRHVPYCPISTRSHIINCFRDIESIVLNLIFNRIIRYRDFIGTHCIVNYTVS